MFDPSPPARCTGIRAPGPGSMRRRTRIEAARHSISRCVSRRRPGRGIRVVNSRRSVMVTATGGPGPAPPQIMPNGPVHPGGRTRTRPSVTGKQFESQGGRALGPAESGPFYRGPRGLGLAAAWPTRGRARDMGRWRSSSHGSGAGRGPTFGPGRIW
jgi:hypothetical protein